MTSVILAVALAVAMGCAFVAAVAILCSVMPPRRS